MQKPYGVASPELLAFLKCQIIDNPRESLDALAVEWEDAFGESCTRSRVDHWFRSPLRMTREIAERLLDLRSLRGKWAAAQAAGEGAPAVPGLFDYHSHKFGMIREVDLTAVEARGLKLADVATQLLQIDASHFEGVATSSAWVGDPQDWVDVMAAYPDTWRAWMTDTNEVLGYYAWVNPTPEVFSRAIAGDYPEVEITVSTLRGLTDGPIHIYGPGMYVKKGLASSLKTWLGERLILSFLYNLRRLEERGCSFSEICISIASTDSRKYAERFRLERMPDGISHRHAQRLGWALSSDKAGLLPAIYYGAVDDRLRQLAGLRAHRHAFEELPSAPVAPSAVVA